MAVPEEIRARRDEFWEAADAEVARLAGIARSLRPDGRQQAAAAIAGMAGGLDHEELAGLLTAAVMQLASTPSGAADRARAGQGRG